MAPILLATELFHPDLGGSAVLFAEIYARLRNVPVTVLTHNGGRRHGGRHRSLRVVRTSMASPQWGAVAPRALAYQLRVAAAIRRLSVSDHAVVHCARPIPEGVSGLMARCCFGRPYVTWTHGEDLACALTSREHAFLVKRVYRHAAGSIANSHHTARMIQSLGVDPSSIHVIHPGVDTNRFHPGVDGAALRARFTGGAGPLLLSVGRLQRRKGHDLVIDAVAALAPSLPDLRYIVVGDGEERAGLMARAAALGVAARVCFVGAVADEDLPAYYAASDLFVMPNRIDQADVEGFGIVFLEAAASGVAAIGGRSGGVPEALAEGETGVLVGGSDVTELAAAIERLVACPEERRRMGVRGRQRAVDQFSWDRAARQLEALHQVIGNDHRHGES